MSEQMIADIAKALHQSEAELFGYVGRPFELDNLWRQNQRRYVREATAAHSVMAGKVAELEEALDLVCKWAGIDLVRRNTVVSAGIAALLGGGDGDRIAAVRDLVAQKTAALAPYPERRSEHHE